MEDQIMKDIKDVTKKKITRAIILADESLVAEDKETYKSFIELYNGMTNGNHIYKVNWKKDFHVVNMKNVKQIMDTIEEILSKIKPSEVLFLSQTISDDILTYYENAAPYFALLARLSNRMIVVSNLLLEMYELNNSNIYQI